MKNERVYYVYYNNQTGKPHIFSRLRYWLLIAPRFIVLPAMAISFVSLLPTVPTVLCAVVVAVSSLIAWALTFHRGRRQAEQNRSKFEALVRTKDQENDVGAL